MAADDLLKELINSHFYKGDAFTLSQAYELFEVPMQEEYPNNLHIRAKIRQQLQVLRDHFFIEFIDNHGYYRVSGDSARARPLDQAYRPTNMPAEEVDEGGLIEGARIQISINSFERNKKARDECIKHHGCLCSICKFDFEIYYGKYGADYIQVHHIIPLSTLTEQYVVDPINDLIPVCANCHAVIHRKRPAYTIDEIKEIIAQRKRIDCANPQSIPVLD